MGRAFGTRVSQVCVPVIAGWRAALSGALPEVRGPLPRVHNP